MTTPHTSRYGKMGPKYREKNRESTLAICWNRRMSAFPPAISIRRITDLNRFFFVFVIRSSTLAAVQVTTRVDPPPPSPAAESASLLARQGRVMAMSLLKIDFMIDRRRAVCCAHESPFYKKECCNGKVRIDKCVFFTIASRSLRWWSSFRAGVVVYAPGLPLGVRCRCFCAQYAA